MFVPCDRGGGGSAGSDFKGFTLLMVSRAPAYTPPASRPRWASGGAAPTGALRSGREGQAASLSSVGRGQGLVCPARLRLWGGRAGALRSFSLLRPGAGPGCSAAGGCSARVYICRMFCRVKEDLQASFPEPFPAKLGAVSSVSVNVSLLHPPPPPVFFLLLSS